MTIHPKLTIGEVVAHHHRTAEVFNRFGIDFCCGGKKTLENACTEKALPFETLSLELGNVLESAGLPSANAANWAPDFLAEYIVQTHHRYLREALPFLLQYSTKIARVHGERHPELKIVEHQMALLAEELTGHMAKEEQILFPYIKRMYAMQGQNAGALQPPFGSVRNPVRMMEEEHEEAGAILENIRDLTHNFTPPASACASYQVTFSKLYELDQDLRWHIHLENNILFPKALLLEQVLNNQN